MCLSPITIKNRSKYFNLNTLHKAVMTLPCGHCAECEAAKKNEYYVRSYYQSRECLDHFGWILSETLTYHDDYLPMFSKMVPDSVMKNMPEAFVDFPVFSYMDFRLFIVQLREELYRDTVKSIKYELGWNGDREHSKYYERLAKKEYKHRYGKMQRFKYFMAAEYGEKRHRPHYHVEFFVYDNTIDPIYFSKLIHKCWGKGRCDGFCEYGANYVLKNKVFFAGQAESESLRGHLNYISKYLVKDSKFENTIRKRLKYAFQLIRFAEVLDVMKAPFYQVPVSDLWLLMNMSGKAQRHFCNERGYDYETLCKALTSKKLSGYWKTYYNDIKRNICQFHRQSQGFGVYMIEKLTPEWIYEHNEVRMPDVEKIWLNVPIPGYIVNKLFKEKKLDRDGNVYYGWSDYGNEFRMYHSEEMLKNVAKKYRQFFNESNLKQYIYDYQLVREALDLVSGINWDDFAYYQKYYKGRILYGCDLSEVDVESYYYIDQHVIEDVYVTSEDLSSSYKHCIIHDKYYDDVEVMYHKLNKIVAKYKQDKYDEDHRMKVLMNELGVKFNYKK